MTRTKPQRTSFLYGWPMSDQLRLRIVGLSILAAFPLFGGGQVLLGGDLNWLGQLMCFSNSAVVIAIGVMMRPVIATTAPRSADIYRAARITEAVLLAISVLIVQGSLSTLPFSSDMFYRVAMVVLGLGSIPMCLWLLSTKIVPTVLGALGLAGYLCLVAAMIASASGSETASLVLLLPGTAFEVIFGVTLVLRRRQFEPT